MLTCVACGKGVDGAYMNFRGQAWHLACFTCAACGERIYMENYLEHESRPYHTKCHATRFSPPCALCGSLIEGAYRRTAGKAWHRDCFQCGGCGQILQRTRFLEKDGIPYHEPCFRKKFHPPCMVCKEPIPKRFFLNGWDEFYCHRHEWEHSKCFSCRRLITKNLTGGGKRFRDGRTLCMVCAKTAIGEAYAAASPLKEVRSFLEGKGLDLEGIAVTVQLVDLRQLRRLIGKPTALPPLGFTRLMGLEGKPPYAEMNVLHSLPGEQFRVALAHELARLWLLLGGRREPGAKTVAGFGALCEFLWLEQRDSKEAAFYSKAILFREDRLHGAGFRSAQAVMEAKGLPFLLAFLRKRGRLPSQNRFMKLLGG